MPAEVLKEAKAPLKQELDYAKFLKIVLSRWYWVAATLIIALLTAYLYLWYTPKQYTSSIYLKFKDEESGINEVLKSSLNLNKVNNITSESWVIRSKTVLNKAVDHFDWQVSYFIDGKVRISEMYPDKPFVVHILKQDSLNFFRGPIHFRQTGKDILISYIRDEQPIELHTTYSKPIHLPGISFYIEQNNNLSADALFYFRFNNRPEFAARIGRNLNISEAEKYSNIAQITKIDENPVFARNALNAIAREYLNQDLILKSQSATQIIDFIDAQLTYLSKNVHESGNKLKDFKQRNNLLQLGDRSKDVFESIKSLETEKRTIELQLLELKQLDEQLNSNQDIALNFNLSGQLDPLLMQLINDWNKTQLDKATLLETYTKQAEKVQNIDKTLQLIRNAAKVNIRSNQAKLITNKNFIDKKLAQEYLKLNGLPTQERALFDLQRDYDINDKIYTLLSQKKLEAQISRAAVLPGAVLVDAAQSNPIPVAPNRASAWKFSWIIGLASGVGLIFLVRALNPYIYDKEMIESLTNTPIVGLIRHYPGKIDEDSRQLLSIIQPKSLFAESVRSVRTNLSFIAGEKSSKVVCITSEISGEGKSFVSVNIAASLGLIDKKVILIAADLRKSRIHRNFELDNTHGLSTYLAHQSTLEDIIKPSGEHNLDLVTAGPVPPNPAELMYKARLTELIETLRSRYDFIIFDTAPIGLVSDALPLIRMSDVNLFVIRTGKSKFSAASIPDRIAGEYQLNNTFIILNDFVQDQFYSHYYTTKYSDGYYGYYYSANTYYSDGYYDDEGVRRGWLKRTWGKVKKKIGLS
ncbi:polysaccharide biosynthesis tyrosine autokinase (plasmid) [Pedobacter sp. BS3]|uniref:GumC family protein n=1 Tax=Pedobacter sp. BS3 TaxID=2567937 RepID=UPI0011ED23AF|nr:tyrosine-protein kinase [Pedobacter sp. BS3]TZF86183.1 polysaccharide biosynthesis tyrosine autokinase [Pedobacter sp. BS3]